MPADSATVIWTWSTAAPHHARSTIELANRKTRCSARPPCRGNGRCERPVARRDLAYDTPELTRARHVVPDRLVEHDPRVLLEAGIADAAGDGRKSRRRRT